MKTYTFTEFYTKEQITLEYDENAPCLSCGEPVIEASASGPGYCPWCDMGKCRYCGQKVMLCKESFDGGQSLRRWRNHMAWHREQMASV